ncbi:UNVERIFIED_CONTAM: G-type lectin S-receptor-like serine/threonine-protein kinase [Sesamum radiatum]|uniref:Receptor-like serine/threonine-protein kinase n=1 Tax=Sesamum radiatum TaxID=300843 RepID=A0AAW2KIX1_SESRA
MKTLRRAFSSLLLTSLITQLISGATDTINVTHRIIDGETMVSSGGMFELGFFSPGNSRNRYVGMWYKNVTVTTVVWVANREAHSQVNQTPVAQLLDSGNLVVRDANDDRPENFLWQSFDFPTDTFLPVELQKIADDPTYTLKLVMNKNEINYVGQTIDRFVVSRFTLSQSGVGQRWNWVDQTQEWVIYQNVPTDICDSYKICGANGICRIGNSPACGCLDRFVPKDPEGWSKTDWSHGCIRRTNLSCQDDVFLKYSGIKLPDRRHSRYNRSMTLEECNAECSRNCFCTAYTQLDISMRSGCLLWFDDLVDIRSLSADGQDIYIRLASSELVKLKITNISNTQPHMHAFLVYQKAHGICWLDCNVISLLDMLLMNMESERKKRKLHIGILTSAMVMVLLGLILILYIQRKKYSKTRKRGKHSGEDHKDAELPIFELATILKATNNFSINNKLGEGGFGPVYKGTLEEGQEIAVKRLSRTSTQGLDEFKNEVIVIAKLQHRNLVRLLGCCIQGEENMLIYEYMPNKSLDVILFDQSRRALLDWPTRFHIINGIARGLLYLHQDSRLRIIHRDIKASNILLDAEMNPRISDLEQERVSEEEQKTHRVVGTYGYMSPEYAVDGLFSVKSDVFSFGVLVLEIVSGKRNRGFSHSEHHLNLLGHAWTLHKEERSLEIVDTSLLHSFDLSEVLRSIHVGLLCVQKKPEDRPSMSSVVLLLGQKKIKRMQKKRSTKINPCWAFICAKKSEDRPSMPSVVLMLRNEGRILLETEVIAQRSATTTTSTNELTITTPEGCR